MTQTVVNEILDVLGNLGKLADGAKNLDPVEVMNSTKALIGEISDVISQSDDIRSEIKSEVETIINDFKDSKNPVDFINDLLALKQGFENISGTLLSIKDALVAAISKIVEAVSEMKEFLVQVGTSGKEMLTTFITEDKEFAQVIKTAWSESKNVSSEHHGFGSFIKQVAGKAKDVVKNDIKAVGKFVHDVVASNETQKLIDFAEGILNLAHENSTINTGTDTLYNVTVSHDV